MSTQSNETSLIAGAMYGRNEADQYLSIRDLLRILRRRRTTIVATVVGLTALSGMVSSLLVPKYTAQAEIMISARPSRVRNAWATSSAPWI